MTWLPPITRPRWFALDTAQSRAQLRVLTLVAWTMVLACEDLDAALSALRSVEPAYAACEPVTMRRVGQKVMESFTNTGGESAVACRTGHRFGIVTPAIVSFWPLE